VVPSNGHLYGTTLYGGSANCTYNYNVGCGVVYEVTP